MTTELVIRRALDAGLSVADFNDMTVGMVLDFLVTTQNERLDEMERQKKPPSQMATQADYDSF